MPHAFATNQPDGPTLEHFGLDFRTYEEHGQAQKRFTITCWLLASFLLTVSFGVVVRMGVHLGYILLPAIILLSLFVENSRSVVRLVAPAVVRRLEAIEATIAPFEREFKTFYECRLERIRIDRLYRKRASTVGFQAALDEYRELIAALRLANTGLIGARVELQDHASYAVNRSFNSLALPRPQPSHKGARARTESQSVTKPRAPSPIAPREPVVVPPPPTPPPPPPAPEQRFRTAKRIDWSAVAELRHKTGLAGEMIVVELERDYLEEIGRKDLADRVQHVSSELGDGLGYDILSFDKEGREKFIEVKATTSSADQAFYLSKNELDFLYDHLEDSFVYRLSVFSDGAATGELRIFTARDVLDGEHIPVRFLVKVLDGQGRAG